MELKEGYKQTGVIPEDWESQRIDAHAQSQRGLRTRKIELIMAHTLSSSDPRKLSELTHSHTRARPY